LIDGLNCLKPPKETPEWVKFLRGFLDPFMVALAAAGSLCFLAYGLDPSTSVNAVLGCVLFTLVPLTVLLTYIQGRSSSSVLASFKNMMPAVTTVIRDGREQRVPAQELVIGDLVCLELGARVPADLRLVEQKDLKVEMSSMTGEADAIACSVDKAHHEPLESRNIVFNSALIMNGSGLGVVIRTGDSTMIGRIAGLAMTTTTVASNMELEVRHFVHSVTKIALSTAIILFIIGICRVPTVSGVPDRKGAITAFINGFIMVLVAFVPEGLPATVASSLTIAARRMAERKVFIKRPDIIEALGAATVIASDKTGTLTTNVMTVENLWSDCSVIHGRKDKNNMLVALSSYRTIEHQSLEGTVQLSVRPRVKGTNASSAFSLRNSRDRASSSRGKYSTFSSFATFTGASVNKLTRASWARSNSYMRLTIAAGVCNRARYLFDADTGASPRKSPLGSVAAAETVAPKITGDASDSALLRFVEKTIDSVALRMAFKSIFEIPFNSENKWSLSVIRDPQPDSADGSSDIETHIMLMKGAPEVVLARCTHYLKNDIERVIDDEFLVDHQLAYERFAFMGERVLGFAYKPFHGPNNDAHISQAMDAMPKDGLVFLGLISLVDPPRDGVAEAVAKCRSASIKVTMVTGDHPLTAEAIARKVGIITLPTARVVALEDGVHEEDIELSDPRVRAIVLPGPALRNLSEAQWDTILGKEECVFARTTPQQKLEIVENLQRRGEVVAVTGDGVNDSPALKRANIGVAMGSAGASDVAREAADIILMDDNFASIVSAVEEGRTLFDNLRKSIAYTIAHTVPELVPTILALCFSIPLGLPALVLLTIDLISEQIPAVSFAYEKSEDSIMLRPPRNLKTDRLVSRQIIVYSYLIAGLASSLACLFAFLMVYVREGIPLSFVWMANFNGHFLTPGDAAMLPISTADGRVFSAEAQTAIYTQSVAAWYVTIIMNQVWHVWICKTRSVSIFEHGVFANQVTLIGVAVALFTAAIFVYIPAVQPYFQTSGLAGPVWAYSVSFGV
jgi:sodium/potassium-transporting ATPase subunit alpha